MYIRRLRNTVLCLCMYICNTCAIQYYARVCMSVTLCSMLVQFSGQNVPPGTTMAPDYCLACVACILWKTRPTSVSSSCPAHCTYDFSIAYDFSYALKIHLNVCRVCCPLNNQIQYRGCLEAVCQMAARAEVPLVLTAIPHAK